MRQVKPSTPRGTRAKTVLFLDIDGVLSTVDQYHPLDDPVNSQRKQIWVEADVTRDQPWVRTVWPSIIAFPLVQAISKNKHLSPVWLSGWAESSICWNRLAKTRNWPVGYRLSDRQLFYIKQHLPALHTLARQQVDEKLVAVRYFLRHRPTTPIVWVEDGFAEETRAWASSRPNTLLVDTTDPEIYEYLLTKHEDPEAAAEQFLMRYCLVPLQ